MGKNEKKTVEDFIKSTNEMMNNVPPILNFSYNLACDDMVDFHKWEIGGTDCLSEHRLKEMRILSTLHKLGYSLNHIGTHLLKELIVDVSDVLDLTDYEGSLKILRDLRSDNSHIRQSLAMEYLEMSDADFMKYVNAAMKKAYKDGGDKEFARKVYGPNGASNNIGVMAYKIAQDFNLNEPGKRAKVIGKFIATTFNDEDLIFKVYDNDTIECTTLDIGKIRTVHLKPRFELSSEVMHYTYDAPKEIGSSSKLIKEFDIDEDLMAYLLSKDMVKYSQDMAIMYGFDPLKSYDRNGGYPFKRAIKKGPILTLEKDGYFN